MITSILSQDAIDLVTLEEAMEHSRLEENYDELVIQGCLAAAHSLVEAQLNRKLSPARIIGVQSRYKQFVKIPYAPIKSVNTVTALDADGNSVTLVAGTNFRVDFVRQMVVLDPATTRNYTVFNIEYDCGYQDVDCVPVSILHAIKMTFATLYEYREDALVGAPVHKVPLTAQRMIQAFKAPSFV